jgi:hypothetical protein
MAFLSKLGRSMRWVVPALTLAGVALPISACGGRHGASAGDYSAAGVRAAAGAVVTDLENGDAKACEMIVAEQQSRCPALVARIHLLAKALGQRLDFSKLKASLQHLRITVAGGRATWTGGTGGQEEAVYRAGHWQFHFTEPQPSTGP